MSTETIARRYSVALADVVSGTQGVDTVSSEVAAWADMFATNADLRNVFSNPTIAHMDKEKLLESLISKTKPGQTTANFVRVLLQNGRLTDIADINSRFSDVLDERRGLVSAEIISARELPEGERIEFEKNLAKLTGKQVTVNYSIDKEIIGGVVTRIGSTVYDGSVKTKLENLREQLING
ncbi:MAG: F0F1 ATP synthase subunit delta [Chloracidobacterium sp.]|nr:F0F1 ATP synthase subunit delta [Chloracidobacterium sp.]